ncbi:MAG: hydrogenase nickel incorporation protein HypB [Vicinamibacteria bacterium]
MCDTCGCGDTKIVPVEVQERVLAANDRQAAHNRAHFREQGVLAVNLMGSPGSGKTAVLEAVARRLAGRRRLGALAGDLATENDADRLRAAGVPSLAITTGSACHLDADMVHEALHRFDSRSLDLLFVENVGNLVCPAVYDLGQAANVVALSMTEGVDKPLKYPAMFHGADLVLLTKIDLLPHLPGISLAAYEDSLRRVMPCFEALHVSATTGAGIDAFVAWLEAKRAAQAKDVHAHAHSHGH